jgi:hypothetical protein
MKNKKLLDKQTGDDVFMGEFVIPNIGDESFLVSFKDDPIKTIAEVAIGVVGIEKKRLLLSFGRILQAAKSQNGCKQLAEELKRFQNEGKINSDAEIAKSPYAVTSLIDLLKIIDGNLEVGKLESIKKAFFYMVSTKNAGEELLAYQLFKIVEKMSASQILVLKAMHDLASEIEISLRELDSPKYLSPNKWIQKIANKLGHGICELVFVDAESIMNLNLISEDLIRGHGGLDPKRFRPNALGEKMCEILESHDFSLHK